MADLAYDERLAERLIEDEEGINFMGKSQFELREFPATEVVIHKSGLSHG